MTPSEGHQLQQELVAWLTMIVDPQPHDIEAVDAQAKRVYEMSPPHAVLALAAVSSTRFNLMQETLRDRVGPDAALQFPREEILEDARPGPGMTRADMSVCLDLVEAIAAETVDPETVQRLLDLGAPAFLSLAAISISVGWMAVGMRPEVETLADLIAIEGVDTEMGWIDREGQDGG